MWQSGEKIGVAVSGGADSVYLLHHLHTAGLSLTVLHINHKLRGGESEADEAFVRSLAASLSLQFLIHSAPIQPGNVEEEARKARNHWFHSLVQQGALDRIALGHTQSDQAETVLFRFLRGSGTAGLAAIRPETSQGIVRPLLHLTREEIRASLSSRRIAWRDDSSNASPLFARNRIRESLIPQLAREWNPAIAKKLSQTAEWALAEEAYWAEELGGLAERHVRFSPPNLILESTESLPLAVQRRLLRHAIFLAKGDLRRIDFSHIEAVRTLRGGRIQLPGIEAEQSVGQLRLGPPRKSAPAFRHELKIPAVIPLPDWGFTLSLALCSADCVYTRDKHHLDWERASGLVELRNWHPGDRFRRVGRSNEEKLKVLFQKTKIPVWERQVWPVLVCGNQIAWTRQFGASADFIRSPATRTVLVVSENAVSPTRGFYEMPNLIR